MSSRVAYHEAGHAVVALALGCEVEYASLDPPEVKHWSTAGDADVVRRAGLAAERRRHGGPDVRAAYARHGGAFLQTEALVVERWQEVESVAETLDRERYLSAEQLHAMYAPTARPLLLRLIARHPRPDLLTGRIQSYVCPVTGALGAATKEGTMAARKRSTAKPTEPTPQETEPSTPPAAKPKKKVSLRDAARKVLANGEEMKMAEIVDAALPLAGWKKKADGTWTHSTLTGRTPHSTLAAQLATAALQQDGWIVRSAPGTYRLRREDDPPGTRSKPERKPSQKARLVAAEARVQSLQNALKAAGVDPATIE